jgi:hypothetical protein
MKDATIVIYSANKIPEHWFKYWKEELLKVAGDYPIISVSHKPMDIGKNIVVGDIGCSAYNVYKQILIGAKEADTEYIICVEDDSLYGSDHFDFYRPKPDTFGYNMNKWSLFTWGPPIYSLKRRKTASTLIAPRKLLIETLEERFAKFPDPNNFPTKWFGEPGRNDYERGMGVKERKAEEVYSKVSCIQISHEYGLDDRSVRHHKNYGQIKVKEICDWPKPGVIQDIFNGKQKV